MKYFSFMLAVSRKPSLVTTCALFMTALVAPSTALAQLQLPEGDEYSVNDFGGIGLLQTRTARFAPDGQLNMGASFVNPYRRYFITWQILPRVELTFRYTDVTSFVFDKGLAFDQSQNTFFNNLIKFKSGNTNLDRGFDIKIKLMEETKYLPALAVGLQDFIGTGLFAGEYVVGSKNIGPFDISLGIGWGNVGTRDAFRNPLGALSSRFDVRNSEVGLGGSLNYKDWFSGQRASLFGGVEYFSPIKGLSVKFEYNSSDPEKDRELNSSYKYLHEDSPFGLAVNYRFNGWFDASVGFERGNSVMLRGSFRANLNRSGIEKPVVHEARVMQREEIIAIEQASSKLKQEEKINKLNDINEQINAQGQSNSEVEMVSLLEEVPVVNADKEIEDALLKQVQNILNSKGFWVYGLDIDDNIATIYLSKTLYRQVPRNVGLVARLITNILPSNVEKITVVELIANFEISRISVMRSDIERQSRHSASAEEIWFNTELDTPRGELPSSEMAAIEKNTYPSKMWWLSPELKQHLGDPTEGLYLADLDIEAGFAYSPMAGLSFIAIGRRFVVGSLDNITRKSDSRLPHVRSDVVEYLQGGKTSIKTMQVDYIGAYKSNWYYRVAAGLFEPMFGGVAAEVLYRPYGKPWGLSVELDWVKQRDFKQLFGFRDYAVVTGHATLNYDIPYYGLRGTVSAGRYLAGDYGMTFELSRRFDNGVRVGGFFTRTNVSAEDFGEGSFDKGFYIRFPFEFFLKSHSKQEANFLFRPLSRDGGQKVGVGPSMFELVDKSNYGVLKREWATIGQ
jgi:hypothetical protein